MFIASTAEHTKHANTAALAAATLLLLLLLLWLCVLTINSSW